MKTASMSKGRTTMKWTVAIVAAALLLGVAPLVAQTQDERLERLRMERLRTALELDEADAQAVQQAMEEVRRAHRESAERERQAFERLRQTLRSEPVDQDAVRQALEAIEREHEVVAQARRQQAERLKQRLTPEQQAKVLLFNRSFDHRLRQLMAQRRGGPMGRPGMRQGPGMRRGPGMRGQGLPPDPGRRRGAAPPDSSP
jgi:Spy/CpxP family protein refolding chaperone